MLAMALPSRADARALPAWCWVPALGIAAGAADLAFAAAWWAPLGVAPIRIPQAIAGWVLGDPAARAGGMVTAAFGALLYFSIISVMVAGYLAAARRVRSLVAHPLACGVVYGAAMYALLFEVVQRALALWSGQAQPQASPAWILACVCAYVVLVGIPAALAARVHLHAAA